MRTLLGTLALALCAPLSFSQGFNVDVGSAGGIPGPTYGAAAAQPGHWTQILDGSGTVLANLDGSSSAVSLSAFGFVWDFSFDNPGTTGDDHQLLDDACAFARSYTFSGLADGDYEVFTYAWAPDNSTYLTKVEVFQSTQPAQLVGGAWSGSHQLGVTYALHAAAVSGGTLGVLINNFTGPATVNGFQLRYLGPGCAPPATYCTAKVSSSGCVPAMGFTGLPGPTGNLVATGSSIEAGQLGVLFHGTSGPAAIPFQDGTLCVAPPVVRFPALASGGAAACTGSFSQPLSSLVSVPGQTFHCQWWFRDPGAASGTGLSDGGTFTTCP